uniref:NADH-ubiquinone oxidoreductase chain 3 n=1 Tax=Eudendrium capillare TaxID=308571 RepID=A0A0S2IBR3_9CNID|nr:NADH dehydrogenase subunit 3 [Eudendrium capillare]
MNLEFYIILIIFLISFILSGVILTLSSLLSDKSPDKEKVSVYECGFDPFHNPGEPFSIKFFLIGILFLIFDLEVTYLFPWSVGTNLINLKGQLIVYLFLFILIIGLIYEWIKGGLDWE